MVEIVVGLTPEVDDQIDDMRERFTGAKEMDTLPRKVTNFRSYLDFLKITYGVFEVPTIEQ